MGKLEVTNQQISWGIDGGGQPRAIHVLMFGDWKYSYIGNTFYSLTILYCLVIFVCFLGFYKFSCVLRSLLSDDLKNVFFFFFALFLGWTLLIV